MIPAMVEIPALPPTMDVWSYIEALCPSTPDPTDMASDLDWRTIEAAAGMEPGQLIAQAFGGIAERAEKIGELNVSPDLLNSLLLSGGKHEVAKETARVTR